MYYKVCAPCKGHNWTRNLGKDLNGQCLHTEASTGEVSEGASKLFVDTNMTGVVAKAPRKRGWEEMRSL